MTNNKAKALRHWDKTHC